MTEYHSSWSVGKISQPQLQTAQRKINDTNVRRVFVFGGLSRCSALLHRSTGELVSAFCYLLFRIGQPSSWLVASWASRSKLLTDSWGNCLISRRMERMVRKYKAITASKIAKTTRTVQNKRVMWQKGIQSTTLSISNRDNSTFFRVGCRIDTSFNDTLQVAEWELIPRKQRRPRKETDKDLDTESDRSFSLILGWTFDTLSQSAHRYLPRWGSALEAVPRSPGVCPYT